MFNHYIRGIKRLRRKSKSEHNAEIRLGALLLSLFTLAGFFPLLAQAADAGKKLSDIVTFDDITLHYAAGEGSAVGETVPDGVLLKPDDRLILRYEYTIGTEACGDIRAGTNYYLEVSPHLVLPDLGSGSPLTIEVEGEQPKTFGTICADGSRAWVTFLPNAAGTGTILSDYDGIDNAYFYLNCRRVDNVPAGETPVEGNSNLYVMKAENRDILRFGYAENNPIVTKAKIDKKGALQNKIITWTIDYTPWQNPNGDDDITPYTPFELRDTIDTDLHDFVDGSAEIDGAPITAFTSRDDIQEGEEAYVIAETPVDGGNTTLTFGGTKFNAGKATQGNPAVPLKITYQTSIKDELLLPGGTGGKGITNTADLFAGKNGVFSSLNISSRGTVPVPQPTWLTKTGKTIRHKDGTGSTTDWTVTFQPNGFEFTEDNHLTLYDQLPTGSTLVENSVKVNGTGVSVTVGASNRFTVSPITTDKQPVTITYQTHVPEEMYNSGTSLGNNVAWLEFDYNDVPRLTPKVTTPIGSGDGSGTPGTATLVKTNTGYQAATRTIEWTVKINPH